VDIANYHGFSTAHRIAVWYDDGTARLMVTERGIEALSLEAIW
jgi:hypothetical protein